MDLTPQPSCEKSISKMFSITLIPCINTQYLKPIPIAMNAILLISVFTPLTFPNYYVYEPVLYSIDLGIAFIVYTYLIYKYRNWELTSCFEHTTVNRLNENISLIFYNLFMMYWFYETVIQFTYHTEPVFIVQFANVFMATAWYLYFSICSLLFYFICIKLAQRTQSIADWLKNLKRTKPSLESFYITYKVQYKAIKKFGKHWNFIVFMGFIILTYHIPIDLVNILYNKRYTDIAGISLKSIGLVWYTYQICALNEQNKKVVSYLYKHKLYSMEMMDEIEKYTKYHELGLNFYGIKIDGSLIIKVALLMINLIIPTIYAIFSNRVFGT